jgi:hypothetical protein
VPIRTIYRESPWATGGRPSYLSSWALSARDCGILIRKSLPRAQPNFLFFGLKRPEGIFYFYIS